MTKVEGNVSVNSYIVFLSNAPCGEGRAMFAAIRRWHPQHANGSAPLHDSTDWKCTLFSQKAGTPLHAGNWHVANRVRLSPFANPALTTHNAWNLQISSPRSIGHQFAALNRVERATQTTATIRGCLGCARTPVAHAGGAANASTGTASSAGERPQPPCLSLSRAQFTRIGSPCVRAKSPVVIGHAISATPRR